MRVSDRGRCYRVADKRSDGGGGDSTAADAGGAAAACDKADANATKP